MTTIEELKQVADELSDSCDANLCRKAASELAALQERNRLLLIQQDFDESTRSEMNQQIVLMTTENAALKKEVEEERELHSMQLAAISTASIQNTETTIKDRITPSNPYSSTAYFDVCKAIDREINLRTQNRVLRENMAIIHADAHFLNLDWMRSAGHDTAAKIVEGIRERSQALAQTEESK